MKPILALDIGGSKFVLGIVSPEGEIITSKQYPIPQGTDMDGQLALFRKARDGLKLYYGESDVSGLGAAIPAMCDARNGLWLHAPFSGINNIPIRDLLADIFKLDTYIENDVNACVVGERRFGACRDVDDFLWVTVSNGVGGGIFADGKLYTGGSGLAGEIGHITVDETDPIVCGCGKKGCVEAMCAGPGIGKRYCRAAGLEWTPGFKSKEVSELARNGDELAKEIFNQTGTMLGKAFATSACLLNPSMIIIGGGVTYDYDLFAEPMQEAFLKYSLPESAKNVRIIKTPLGYNAALIGAAALVP